MSELERLAAELHAVYQDEARRQGDVRHADAYEALPENIKEFDRVLARFILERAKTAEAEVERLTRELRFWQNVQRSAPDECWLWLGGRSSPQAGRDYGRMTDEGRSRSAAQISWEIEHGEAFPEGMDACHVCDNPPCVNPTHIFPGTPSDNAKDAYRKGRLYNPQSAKTHCSEGHPLSGDNLYVSPAGNRYCKECKRRFNREWRARAALRETEAE